MYFKLVLLFYLMMSQVILAIDGIQDKVEKLLSQQKPHQVIAFQSDLNGDGNQEIILANKYLILVFDPQRGGIATHCIYRSKGIDMTGQHGLFEDDIWQLNHDEQEFKNGSYSVEIENKKDSSSVILRRRGIKGIYQWLTITKQISLDAITKRIRADYKIHNDPNSVGAMDVGLWFHQQIGTKGGNRYFVPTRTGVEIAVQGTRSPQDWWHNPSRGWRAIIGKGGIGIAAVMDYRYLKNFYNWHGKMDTPTFEWRFHNISLQQDETFSTTFYLIFFEGLNRVDEATKDTVIALNIPEYMKPGQVCEINANIISFESTTLDCDLSSYVLPERKSKKIDTKHYSIKTLPGKCNLKFFYKLPKPGTHVMELTVNSQSNKTAQAERVIIVGKSSAEYEMIPRQPNFADPNEKQPVHVELSELMKYNEDFITPHIKWNKPSANGKIKALILVPASGGREIAELAQRFDLDYKTIYINQSNPWTHGDYFYVDIDPQIRKGITTLLSDKQYDVIILGGIFWTQYLQGSGEKLLLEQIRNGAGLVYVGPHDLSQQAEEILPVTPDDNPTYRTKASTVDVVVPHPIIAGLDMSLLGSNSARLFKAKAESRVILKIKDHPWLTVNDYGKGRIAVFTYRVTGGRAGSEVGGGLTPRVWDYDFGSMGKASKWNYNYWEYYLSLLGKTIRWAANQKSTIAIQDIDAKRDGQNIVVTVQFDKAIQPESPIKLTIEMLDHASRTLGSNTTVIVSGSQTAITLDKTFIPRSGRNIIHVIASTLDGDIHDFGTASLNYQAPVSISDISLKKRIISKDENVTGTVTVSGQPKVGDSLTVDLYDCFQRLVDRRSFPIPPIKNISFLLSAHNSMEVQGWVEVTLLRGKQILDIRRKPLKFKLTTEERKWDDFKVKSYSNMWSLGMPAYLYPYFSSVLRQCGMNDLEIRPDNPQEAELTSQQGFRVLASGIAGMKELGAINAKKMYLETREKKYLVRKKDLCDPNYLKDAHAFVHKMIKPVLPYSTDYMMYDEDAYSFYGMDFNFSEPSLKAFRNWLKTQYGSLDELNSQWATTFMKWDDVVPMTLLEIRERQKTVPYNVAPWAAHRKFNEVTVIDTWNRYRNWIHELDPSARIGQSGTRPSGSYGGNDWSRLASTMDFIESYANYGHQGKYIHCFTKSHITPWSAGYTFTDEAKMWNNAIREGRGGISAYRSISLVRPDLSGLYSTGQALARFASQAQSGLGKLVHGKSVVYQGDVGIHFSANCIRSAWALGMDLDKIRDAYCDLLESMGYQYFYLSDLEMSRGSLTPERFKMLILPYSAALSQVEIDAIKKYVKDGGVVFADLHPGLMTEHCSPLAKSSLEDMFGLELRSLKTVTHDRVISWGDVIFKPNLAGELDLKDTHVNRYGKGYAVYSDAIIVTLYDALRKKSFIPDCVRKADAIERGIRKFLELAKASPPATVSVGTSHPNIGISDYTDGTSRYLIIVDNKFPRKQQVTVDWQAQKTGYLYDALKGSYLGEAGQAKLLLTDIGNVFVALPYKVEGLDVTCLKTAGTGQKIMGEVKIITKIHLSLNRHVIKMEVRDPVGKLRKEYSRNLNAQNGLTEFMIPFALNDIAGEWNVQLKDIISGYEKTIKIHLTATPVDMDMP